MIPKYLIGKGESLVDSINNSKRPVTYKHIYTFEEAKQALIPQINESNNLLSKLPANACPNDFAVTKMILHPQYIAKSYFPSTLLREADLFPVGSRAIETPLRKPFKKKPLSYNFKTTELLIAGQRKILRELPDFISRYNESDKTSIEFSRIESYNAMTMKDRLHLDSYAHNPNIFEVTLHFLPDDDEAQVSNKNSFIEYARSLGFKVDRDPFLAGRLLFFAVEGDADRIHELADFTLTRIIRTMPKLRFLNLSQSKLHFPFILPTEAPLSKEPRVAILDGGLPADSPISRYANLYKQNPEADDLQECLAHGLAVTSAFLFGSIELDSNNRPFSNVDHYRIIDSITNSDNPLELFDTLEHVENVLRARKYEFVNISLGPDLPINDKDVHVWTAVLDNILSDGNTLLTVAAGNNGNGDCHNGNTRILVPADSVNALSVGASNSLHPSEWQRASYSASGPGRRPGIRKPDILAFGGSEEEPFNVITLNNDQIGTAQKWGTSFAAPLALRAAVGIRAILGEQISPLTAKALLIHNSKKNSTCLLNDVGWGCIPNKIKDLITCDDSSATILYQGKLKAGKLVRARIPLPNGNLNGLFRIRATLCYVCQVDPQDADAYTKAGLTITFRPNKSKKRSGASNPNSKAFFSRDEYEPEEERRNDAGKWETVMHNEKSMLGTSLSEPMFDIHYVARDMGGQHRNAPDIPYALVLTIIANDHPNIYQDILEAYPSLDAFVPLDVDVNLDF